MTVNLEPRHTKMQLYDRKSLDQHQLGHHFINKYDIKSKNLT